MSDNTELCAVIEYLASELAEVTIDTPMSALLESARRTLAKMQSIADQPEPAELVCDCGGPDGGCSADCDGTVEHRYCEPCYQAQSAEAYEAGRLRAQSEQPALSEVWVVTWVRDYKGTTHHCDLFTTLKAAQERWRCINDGNLPGGLPGEASLLFPPTKRAVHGTPQDSAPQDKGEVCLCDDCPHVKDCTECEKPEQWEDIHAKHRVGLEMNERLHGRLDAANARICAQRILIANRDAEWISIRDERDAARAEVDRLREGVRDVIKNTQNYSGTIATLRALLEPKQDAPKCYVCGNDEGLARCTNGRCDGWVCAACCDRDGKCSVCSHGETQEGQPPPDSLKRAREAVADHSWFSAISWIITHLESERGGNES